MSTKFRRNVNNRDARELVATMTPFATKNKSMYARWLSESTPWPNSFDPNTPCEETSESSIYTVYSYGPHFPMYIYDRRAGKWFGNKDKYSSTTSRHQTHAHPPRIDHWYDTERMVQIDRSLGLAGMVGGMMLEAA